MELALTLDLGCPVTTRYSWWVVSLTPIIADGIIVVSLVFQPEGTEIVMFPSLL